MESNVKSLATLIKLQKSHVDEQRILLAALQDQLAKIKDSIRHLRREREEQKKLLEKKPEMGLTYGEYIKASGEKERALEKKKRTAEIAVSIALDKLAELFEEQKRYEIAQEARLEAKRKEERRKETHFLDEVGSVSFVRKEKK